MLVPSTAHIRQRGHLSGLGFVSTAALLASTAPCGPACTVPILVVTVIGTLYTVFKTWFHSGEMKVLATAKAEHFVDSIWGTRTPNSPPDQDSVSKLIEDCKLVEAQEMIIFLARQMSEKAAKDEHFNKWAIEWGALTLKQIQSKLDAYKGYCAPSDGGTSPTPPPQEPTRCPPDFSLVNGRCVPLGCPNGFYLVNGKCEMMSPQTMPPALDSAGSYVALPQASASGMGLGLLFLVAGLIIVSRR